MTTHTPPPASHSRGPSTSASLFPLPLEPIELVWLLDERPDFPMTYAVELVVRGAPSRDALERAVDDALARHPLLDARVAWRRGRPYWIPADRPRPPIEWRGGARPDLPMLDLSVETGLRIVVVQEVAADVARASIMLFIHHACCDGQGARRFCFDLLTGYVRALPTAALPSGWQPPDWQPLDYERLRRRGEWPAAPPSGADFDEDDSFSRQDPDADEAPSGTSRNATSWREKLRNAWQFHSRRPRPLARPAAASASILQPSVGAPTTTNVLCHLFTIDETTRLRRGAARAGCTLNDVAAALLLRTSAEWNRRHGESGARRWLRIVVPTDLRDRGDERLPAANRMSFLFVARPSGACDDWPALLAGVARESRRARRLRLGLDFLRPLALLRRFPRLMRALARWPSCAATAVLSNIGDGTRRLRRRFPIEDGRPRIGDLQLEQILAAPPIRPKTFAGFGLSSCAGRMSISLRTPSSFGGPEATERLLNDYVRKWLEWLDAAHGADR